MRESTVTNWTTNDIADQTGRVIVITGANSGIGYESAHALAGKGATVVMACRNAEKGAAAREAILHQFPNANVQVMALDLGSLASVRAFAEAFNARFDRLDVLMNNAGVMAVPEGKTVDGFETQFGTNHLGHFALTGLLLEKLLESPGSRVVTTSSFMYLIGRINFDDLQATLKYSNSGAYANSKLANMLFALELQCRLARIHADTISVVSHPGWAATNLQGKDRNSLYAQLSLLGNRFIAQDARGGARYQLYAATAADVVGGGFYGPPTLIRGPVRRLSINSHGKNRKDAARLWQLSEEMTGVEYSAFVLPAPI